MDLTPADGGARIWRLEVAGSWLARDDAVVARGGNREAATGDPTAHAETIAVREAARVLGRPSLAAGEGLYLPGTNGVHMLFMRFAIDCLFLGAPRDDGSHQVVALRANLAPWTGVVWWIRGAHGAIEVPAGSVAASGLSVGDYVRLVPIGSGSV